MSFLHPSRRAEARGGAESTRTGNRINKATKVRVKTATIRQPGDSGSVSTNRDDLVKNVRQ